MKYIIGKYSALSIMRAKYRNVLLGIGFFLITLLLCFSLNSWYTFSYMMKQCDENYLSVAQIEYIDSNPDEQKRAVSQINWSNISAIDGIIYCESAMEVRGYIGGYNRTTGNLPYKNYGILIVNNFHTPTYKSQKVPIHDTKELAEGNVAITDSKSGTVTYYTNGKQVYRIPCYYYDINNNRYFYWARHTDGSYEEIEIKKEQIPFACCKIVTAAENEEIWNSGDTFYNNDTVRQYWLSSDENVYYKEIQVVDSYIATVVQTIYSESDVTGHYVYLELGDSGFVPDESSSYIMHGCFVESDTPIKRFSIVNFTGSEVSPFEKINEKGNYPDIFDEYTQRYQTTNNYLVLQSSEHISALEAFQQGHIYVTEGEIPQYQKDNTCAIDGITAERLGITVGDTICIQLLRSTGNNTSLLAPSETLLRLDVVGITTKNTAYNGYIWTNTLDVPSIETQFGNKIGFAIISNKSAEHTTSELQQIMPDGVKVTLYDQGYGDVAQPLQNMITISSICIIACLFSIASLVFVFEYLLFQSQKNTIKVLTTLGVSSSLQRTWIYIGNILVAGIPVLCAVIVGSLLSKPFVLSSYQETMDLYIVDEEYSESQLGYEIEPTVPDVKYWHISLLVVLLIFLLVMLAYLVIAQRRDSSSQRRIEITNDTQTIPGRDSKAPLWLDQFGLLRYSLISAWRNSGHSVVVALSSCILIGVLLVFSESAELWKGEKKALISSNTIKGGIVSTDGRYNSGLDIAPHNIKKLWDTGALTKLSVSVTWNYWIKESMPEFSHTEYGQEQRQSWISSQDSLIALNDLSAEPRFFYSEPNVKMLDGWNLSFLQNESYECFANSIVPSSNHDGVICQIVYPVLVNEWHLENSGLNLGDTFEIVFNWDSNESQVTEVTLSCFIVGYYKSIENSNDIFIPLVFYYDINDLYGNADFKNRTAQEKHIQSNTVFSTTQFTLMAEREHEFKALLLAMGFSSPNKIRSIRTTILVRDSVFLQTEQKFERYILLGNALRMLWLIIVFVISFVISWFQITRRKRDLAIMLSMGASRKAIFTLIFVEQLLLVLLGCSLIALVTFLHHHTLDGHYIFIVCYLSCYMLGISTALMIVNRSNLWTILMQRE